MRNLIRLSEGEVGWGCASGGKQSVIETIQRELQHKGRVSSALDIAFWISKNRHVL